MFIACCSGPQAKPDGQGTNNPANAAILPIPANASVDSSTNASAAINDTKISMVSYEKAVNSVRRFLGEQEADVTIECAAWDTGYSMASGGNYFFVNGQTGEVDYADFLTNPAGNFFSGNVISVEQGRSIAQAFAAGHYLGFDANASWHYEGSALHQDDRGGYFYQYEWRESAGDKKTLNDVIVTVGVGGGSIHTYQGIIVPAGGADYFPISRRDATRIAVQALGNITGEDTRSDDSGQWAFHILFKYAIPDSKGNMYGNYTISDIVVSPDLARGKDYLQRVVWKVDLDTGPVPANGTVAIHWHKTILVDVGNGEVLDIIHYR
jgi:hypothetical protein